jgi:hypothetical protein
MKKLVNLKEHELFIKRGADNEQIFARLIQRS